MTFQMPTHCEACGTKLSPVDDWSCWNLCTPCWKAGREFAEGLPVEHEAESPEAAAL